MAMKQCPNGHFYDDEVNAACPYCGKEQPVINFGGATQAPPGWGGGGGYGSQTQAPRGWPRPDGGATQAPNGQDGTRGGTGGTGGMGGYGGKTQPPSGWGTNQTGGTGSYGGRTQPPSDWKPEKNTDEGKTMPIMHKDVQDPDVGWLVCIGGPDKGRTYPLKAKGNTIGRAGSGHKFDISLDKDMNISRDAAVASIGYDAKRNSFVFICGESSILYLNGEVAGSRSPLAPFDVIEIGNSETVLLFVPLCGSRFDWINGLKGGAVR